MEKKEAKKTPFPADDQATRTEFGHPRSSILLDSVRSHVKVRQNHNSWYLMDVKQSLHLVGWRET
jgi:hypothetical protein